jgi:uncharacterized protein (TIGR03118 family)
MPDLRRRTARAAVAALTLTALTGALAPAAADAANSKHGGNAYAETLLVSDRAADNAVITDPTLVNPWGVALTATSPLWVNKEETALSTLYRSSAGTPSVTQLFSVATVPHPTGIVANPTGAFLLPGTTNPARFIFDSLSGRISAWTNVPVLAPTDTTVVTEPGAAFTGLAISANAPGGPRLYAADAAAGVVRMYDGTWQPVGTFRDPNLPPKMTPYGIQVIGDRLYVTYAPPPDSENGLKGAVDVYTLGGQLVRRLATGGPLHGPWGLALAPEGWGAFGGDLLVGNEDGGAINAFDPQTGHFEGTVSDANGAAIAHDGLWGIVFGNGTIGTPQTLITVAGEDAYMHGVITAITPAD